MEHSRNNKQIPVRANASIWRLAEWLYIQFYCGYYKEQPLSEHLNKNHWYDKAAELLKKISLGEFTGEDGHND